jgi:hypothetical protein
MRRAVLGSQSDYGVRRVAEAACQGLDSKDYLSEYLACYQYLLQHCRYMRDPRTVELVRSPQEICRQLLAGQVPQLDCDDMACLLASWVTSMGGRAELVTVAFADMYYDGRRQYSHVYCRAYEPRSNQWIVLDPVAAEKTGEMLKRVQGRFHNWGI